MTGARRPQAKRRYEQRDRGTRRAPRPGQAPPGARPQYPPDGVRPVAHARPLPRESRDRENRDAREHRDTREHRPRPKPPRPRRILARGDPNRRLGVTLLCIVFVLSLFAGRLVQLQGMESASYRKQAEQEATGWQPHTIALPAVRGSILAANGQVLALTVQTYTVFVDPPEMPAAQRQQTAAQLAKLLNLPSPAILTKIEAPTSPLYPSPDYRVLAKNVPAATANAIQALNLTGVGMTANYARSYPDGDITSNILGFTSTDSNGNLLGEGGLEYTYNSLLAGHPGSETVQTSNTGQQIPLAGSSVTQAVNGRNVKLTIYPALQYKAMQACQQQVATSDATSCSVVIMQPQTGAILAMAQWPTFDPTNIQSVAQTTDLATEHVFDPGSTAKVITAAAAFEHGGQTPMSSYYIPYQITEGGTVIHDAEWSPGEHYTIAGIIANSSNIGMSQVVKHVTPQVQYDYLRAFGLGQDTNLGVPESAGILPTPAQWFPDTRYTLSYGQGVSVTAVQMASVYATIANGGVRVQPTLIAGTTGANGQFSPASPSPSRRVITAQTAHELIQILQQVPYVDEEGGQPWGLIPGYAIAAKTGTSQESTNSCTLCIYGASYIGMAPGDNPQLIVAVNVQNPRKGGHFGDIAAGPVFYQVMRAALAALDIPPDGAQPAKIRLNAP